MKKKYDNLSIEEMDIENMRLDLENKRWNFKIQKWNDIRKLVFKTFGNISSIIGGLLAVNSFFHKYGHQIIVIIKSFIDHIYNQRRSNYELLKIQSLQYK